MLKLPRLEARPAKKSPKNSFETEIVPVFQDGAKKAIAAKGPYAGLIEKARKSGTFTAKLGQAQFIRFGGKGSADHAILLGLGSAKELSEEKIRGAGGSLWSKLAAERARSAGIRADAFADLDFPVRSAAALAEGLTLAAYQFDKYKSKKGDAKKAGEDSLSKLVFTTANESFRKELECMLARVTSIGDAVKLTRDWSNEPSNIGTPEYYAAEAKALAKELGLKCTILSEQDAKRERMELFLGVGLGSEREGKIVILEYNPKIAKGAPAPKTIALVGKGITFDSGGISIKPSMKMEDMKHDMTGAATVTGAIALASKWQVSNRIVAILAFTENMPAGNAIQPGNVLNSRAGKTVEVINTDAEGRLILADALDFAHTFKPDAIIDVATLTGAVMVALGKHCCGILGNDDGLIEMIKRAGDVNGERLWQLPLFDEYFDDLKSDIADMKNSANDPMGGTIRGAIFLKQFIKKGMPWAHLDIAATAWSTGHLSYLPKRGASGTYVRTLAQFASDF